MTTMTEDSTKPPFLPLLLVSQIQVIWVTVMMMEHQMRGDEGAHVTLDEQAEEFVFSSPRPVHTVELHKLPPVSATT